MSEVLFQPFSLKTLNIKNRIVMAPMTRSFSPKGIPTKDVANYYQRRADSEVGLIISEGTVINRVASSNDENIPHFYGQDSLTGWKQVIDQVHKRGGAMAPQIWHMGIMKPHQSGWMPQGQFEGPSGLVNEGVQGGSTMSESDIIQTIQAYADAAINSKKLGFDAVEVHGAHGYLIDQFFWDVLNKRSDMYGGKTLKERSRFAVDVIKSIRKAVGEDYPIILRLSQWKQQNYDTKLAHSPQEMEDWLVPLADAGVDIFHCSQRKFWEPEFSGSHLNFAGWAKKITGKATISVGSVGLSGEFIQAFRGDGSTPVTLEALIERMDKNEFDLIAVGRALLADPEWVKKIKSGRLSELKGFDKKYLSELY